jgi:hypothetical protein
MAPLVILFGVLITAMGVAGLAAPQWIVGGILSWQPRTRFYLAVGIRFGFGGALVLAASTCRFSTVIFALGAIALVAALALALLGERRVDSMLQWWLQRPMFVLRAWFAAAVLFGGFLVYAGF